MGAIASLITSLTIVYLTVYSGADQRNCGNSPHKWPVTRKMFPFDNIIMFWCGRGGNRQEPNHLRINILYIIHLSGYWTFKIQQAESYWIVKKRNKCYWNLSWSVLIFPCRKRAASQNWYIIYSNICMIFKPHQNVPILMTLVLIPYLITEFQNE